MSLALGIGAASGVGLDELTALVDRALDGLDPEDVDVVGTVTGKRDEPALRELCARRGWALTAFDADVLAGVGVPHPSQRVQDAAGTPSVAEAAALLLGAALLVGKTASAHATVAVARR
jgi:cobalamin biosynthesis protein CbiG